MAKNYRHFLLAGLSGLLLALAYPGWSASWRINFSFLVWIGLIPLFYSLSSSYFSHDREKSMMNRGWFLKSGFITGFVAGLFYFLIIFRWFWSIHPLDTLGIQNNLASFAIVLLVYIISSAGMAVFWGLFGLAFSAQRLAFSRFHKHQLLIANYQLLVTPAIFVLLEYARSYGFGLLWAGSGILFGPHWTLGNLAYALAGNPLALQLATYLGIYGISFIIVFINVLLFSILSGGKTRLFNYPPYGGLVNRRVVVAAVIVLALALTPKFFKPISQDTGKKINFAVIQTNQPTKISPAPKETLDAFKEQLNLLKRVAEEYPESQLIIFPEASDFFKNLSLFLTGNQIPNYFANLFKEPRLIISGARVIDSDGRAYSRVFSLDTQKDIIGFYDKRLLTPQGEFLSYPTRLIVNLFSKTKVSEFGALRELGVGRKKVSTVNFRDQFSPAPIVCSELWAPGLVQEITYGSDVIAGMTSYGIFHGSSSLVKQTLASARFRAAENQKPLIAASNMGLSYAIDSHGNIEFITPNQNPQILTGSVALNPQKSWYNKVGDVPMLVGSLVLVVCFAVFPLLRSKKHGFNA